MLTPCERAFIRASLATEDVDARMRLWRQCGCPDGSDVAVKQRIGALLKSDRADVLALIESERKRAGVLERVEAYRDQKQRKELRDVAGMVQSNAVLMADEVLQMEFAALQSGARKTPHGFTKLFAEVQKLKAGIDDGSGLTDEQAKAAYDKMAERKAQLQAEAQAPVAAAPAKQQKPSDVIHSMPTANGTIGWVVPERGGH